MNDKTKIILYIVSGALTVGGTVLKFAVDLKTPGKESFLATLLSKKEA